MEELGRYGHGQDLAALYLAESAEVQKADLGPDHSWNDDDVGVSMATQALDCAFDFAHVFVALLQP